MFPSPSLQAAGGSSRHRRRAFTLIELIVVVIIIAILAAIAGVAYNTFVGNARSSALEADAQQTDLAITARSAQDDKTPSAEVAAAFSTGTGTVVASTTPDSAAFAKYFSISSEAGKLTFTPDDVNAPTTLTVALGSRAECLTLGTEPGRASTITAGECGRANTQPYPTPSPSVVEPPIRQLFVTTLAGSSTYGFADGTGGSAKFWSPEGVAVDGSGNVYVADANNHRIRKIAPGGVVTTLAGSGTSGAADGTGASAQFTTPVDVAVDTSGNVLVADSDGNRIRKITPSGVVTTLAGSGTAGFADGTGLGAEFHGPSGIAVDKAGNVYVADKYNNRIRKITPSGAVTTFAGSATAGFANGSRSSALFSSPCGVVVDASGNVLVSDLGNNAIRSITPTGAVSTLAGSGVAGYADGTSTAAQFNMPRGLAVDGEGDVYVADEANNRVRKISPEGVVTTLAGSGTRGFADGSADTASFFYLLDVAVDTAGSVYVADFDNSRIRKIG